MNDAQWVDLLMNEPPEGSLVRLRLAFPGSPTTYTYAGIRARGQWHLTGRDPGPWRWAELFAWLASKHAEIVSAETATTWESL